MALEKAGISLEAQNFNKYIKQLETINKTQEEIFDVDSSKLEKSIRSLTKSVDKLADQYKDAAKQSKQFEQKASKAGAIAGGAVGVAVTSVLALTDALLGLASTATSAFLEITKGGVALNQQFELSEKVFSNVFNDPNLGGATIDFINESADRLRIARGEAASFAQTILPKTDNLDTFIELLRLTDIQADTTGQSVNELEFSIREALSGDFVSLKDRFDLGTEQINRIKELTPELGRSQALVTVLTEEFTRLGKTDISGTLSTNIKDLQSTFTNLQVELGKPTFEQLRVQSENLLGALNRNKDGLQTTAIALGEVTSNVVELVGTELVEFIDNLDFSAIKRGIDNLNAFIEGLRFFSRAIKEAFQTGVIQTAFGLLTGNVNQLLAGINKVKQADFGQSFQNITQAATTATQRQLDYKKRVDEAANSQSRFTDGTKEQINAFLQQNAAADQSAKAVESYTNTLKQAQSLQLSFARAAEDSALKLSRANEDIARKQGQQVAKLQNKQAKDRDKLLRDQAKRLDEFESGRRSQIASAEKEIAQARREAANQRKRDQQKLFNDLQKAQEKFNLSQLQSQRRFDLQEDRLIAEGDVIGLKELREDFALQQQEEKENFALSQKETKDSAKEQQKEQSQDFEKRLDTLKSNLEDQRAQLLQSFDQQLAAQQEAQQEAKLSQQRAFDEQAAERAIQLQREEEDRRISQQRQLEDLGRSFAEQEGVTIEGTTAIASQLEKVFGIDGTADNIISGFTAKTENDFTELFDNLEKIVKDAEDKITPSPRVTSAPTTTPLSLGGGGLGSRIGGLPEFDNGGIVPGPIGSPQLIQAHGGETVLPTHQSSYQMAAPVIPSQNLTVSGDVNVRGSGFGQASEQAVQEALVEVTESFRIAIDRVARRN